MKKKQTQQNEYDTIFFFCQLQSYVLCGIVHREPRSDGNKDGDENRFAKSSVWSSDITKQKNTIRLCDERLRKFATECQRNVFLGCVGMIFATLDYKQQSIPHHWKMTKKRNAQLPMSTSTYQIICIRLCICMPIRTAMPYRYERDTSHKHIGAEHIQLFKIN